MFTMRALFFAGLVSSIAGFLLHRYLLIFGLILIFAAAFPAPKASDAVDQLGREERIVFGVRFPGFGMLANKPRDSSRLTKWRHWKESEGLGPLGFTCENCLRPHNWSDMHWIPNVAEDEEEPGTAAVDPEGGRYVLICPCGVGHYVLKQVSLDALDPRQSRRDEKGRR